jgi:hypothetical protein
MEATYSQLGVHVHAPWRVVVRAARGSQNNTAMIRR